MVVRLCRRDQRADLRVGHAARIGDLREVVAVVLEILDVLLGRHPDDDELAVFVRLADRLDLHARRCLRERAVVLEDVGVVRQLRRRADVVPEHVLRRRNSRRRAEVIDERTAELRPLCPLDVELREVFILSLFRVARFSDGLLRGKHRGSGAHK